MLIGNTKLVVEIGQEGAAAFEEDAPRWFVGNFSDYEADRRRRLGPAADTPARARHRKLTRD